MRRLVLAATFVVGVLVPSPAVAGQDSSGRLLLNGTVGDVRVKAVVIDSPRGGFAIATAFGPGVSLVGLGTGTFSDVGPDTERVGASLPGAGIVDGDPVVIFYLEAVEHVSTGEVTAQGVGIDIFLIGHAAFSGPVEGTAVVEVTPTP